ncbi:T9SS type B sorting domain-containing protein [Mangrovimonas sp. YM274]|uniref:T9SS type B sorting domain-containing protein n=1 Tax=Mangrovimonas sp. YM274 TaxID=3070660 RepID=UPI0027DBAF89|nr:choice-of-anchor L domain-containing protein [Mangrovimonas sp. YM274]WMI67852.1 choice-of-anchor L domain-containing protein [Mangrovimonas sp. YM274]
MKAFKISLLIFACFLCNPVFSQQISVDTSYSAQELIEDILVQGCVEISNVTSAVNGSGNGYDSFGYFEKADSNFPFDNGIILSTGNAASAGNTPNPDILNEGEPDWGPDTDLENALGISGTVNATSIEFDIVSISNEIQFNYILASEEYFGNFPCQYSDGFAFLIKETGNPGPYTNIAVIPGTSTPVNTNTIHDEIAGFCPPENEEYFAGYSLGDTNFNGRTTVMTATASITPNVQYHVKLVIADQTDENYDSAVFVAGNSFNTTVNLGDDLTTCASSVTLNADIENPLAVYSWYLDNSLISGETQPTLNVTESGTYKVVIEIPISNTTCTIEDSVVINLSSTQTATPIDDFEICDDLSNNGVETFDLSTMDSVVLQSVPQSNYDISYHYSQNEANNNTNPITSPIQNTSSPETIYVRIEDIDNGCLAYSTFNLVVNPLPVIVDPTDLLVCDDTSPDGVALIDLTEKNDEITAGQTNLIVSYHYSQSEADTGANPIPSPYTNTNPSEQLYVRVIDAQTGCASTTTLNLLVQSNPVINSEDLYIDACDPDHDGFASFDLNSIIDEVLNGLTGVSTTFHETPEDALLGDNPIPNPSNYDNETFEVQTVYIRVVDDLTGCVSVAPVEIHPNLLLTGTNIIDFSLCDVDSDGTENFDLENMAITIANDIPDVSIAFYLSETDRANQVNELDQGTPFSPTEIPQTLYLTISSPTCEEYAEIEINLTGINEFDSIGTVEYCDNDQDGLTLINLSSFDDLVTGGQSGYTVSYFASESDAESNINALPDPYNNVSNPQTFYTRIRFNDTGCASVNSFQVSILSAPTTTTPTPIKICDDNDDGEYTVDLTSKIPEVTANTANQTITFHSSFEDADTGSNPIANTTNYTTATQTLFIRVENGGSACYSLEPLEIYINTLPQISEPISDYKICEQNSDNIGDFTFITRDEEILNGQTDKQVLYFASQSDAENRTNIIDKTVPYQNTANPQIIYVRIENITDEGCYITASFSIEIGTNPQFNKPLDWFLCDDIANDGFEEFDLNVKAQEMTDGINEDIEVTFYLSMTDAENEENPIPANFTNTTNPQTIFVSLSNGSFCNSTTSFEINVIQAPEANPAQPLIQCDTDFDAIVTFDLTQAEVDILDVRQEDIVISYYETLDELEIQVNEIPDPTTYNNTTNPQTVYFRITNTTSGCYLAIPIELIVNLPPPINQIGNIEICENEDNYYDLNEASNLLLDDLNGVTINYFETAADAEANTNAISTDYTYQSYNDIIHVRAEYDDTGCFATYFFVLRVKLLPNAITPPDLVDCDDDYDGFLTFDLSQQDAAILGNQNPLEFTVTYYTDEASANSGTNALPLPSNLQDQQTVYARVENNETGCYSLTQFMVFINPKPVVDIPDQAICLDNLPLVVDANTFIDGDTYLWSTGATTPEIEIDEIGIYSVTVTTIDGCSTTSEFTITESEQANIEFTEILDFSDPNNVTVTVSGIGNYLYQWDDEEPQESNVFENVTYGYHTITVIDLNGCSEVAKEIVVVDAPKFMTPNNDGYTDTWHIVGVETLPGTVVYIFDRFGKLLKQLSSDSEGWDGTYNGHLMPASDYWFVANVKRGDIEFEVRGHFALRR